MSVAYVDLVDYVAIAAEVTGLKVDTLMRVAKLDLADSALHAPAAGFGDVEFYLTSWTRPQCSSSISPRTTRCRTATNAPPGSRWRLHRDQRLDLDHATNRQWRRARRPRYRLRRVGRDGHGRLAARTPQRPELTPKDRASVRDRRRQSPGSRQHGQAARVSVSTK